MLGDWLYGLTPRDEQITALDAVHTTFLYTQAGVSVQQKLFTVPQDRALILCSATLICTPEAAPGVAQNARGFIVHHGQNIYFMAQHFQPQPTAPLPGMAELKGGPVLIEPLAEIWFVGGFSTPGVGAGNSILASILGYMIPRGNIAVD